MAVNLGTAAIAGVNLGSTPVSKIYLGTEQVYGGSPVPSDPEYGEVTLYGYTVSDTVIDNVSGGTVTVNNEDALKRMLETTTLPITITVSGDDVTDPFSWTIETSNPGVYIDTMMFNEAILLNPNNTPFEMSFTVESIGGTSIDKTTTTTRTLTSVAEFNQLVTSGTFEEGRVLGGVPIGAVKEVKVGTSITSIPNNFLRYASALDNFAFATQNSVTSIGTNFLQRAGFDSQIPSIVIPDGVALGTNFLTSAKIGSLTLPSDLTAIPNNFLEGAILTNAPTLPNTLTTIGNFFMSGCVFNQPLTLPPNLTSVGVYFLSECSSMTSTINLGSLDATVFATSNYTCASSNRTAASYTTGITIKGTYRSAFMSRFPNRTSSPYRKLVDGGA